MTEKILGLLGLMRRASAIAPGEDSAQDAVKAGKALRHRKYETFWCQTTI